MDNLDNHRNLVGRLYKILGWILLIAGLIASVIGAIALLNQESFNVASILTGIVIMLPLFALGYFHILAGGAFQARKNWATTAIWVLSVLNLGNVPLGTALGIYSMIVLVQSAEP